MPIDQNVDVQQRPFGLYVIIFLQVIIALSLAAGLLLHQYADLTLPLLLRNRFLFSPFGWLIVIAFLTASLSLFRLKRWGWTLSMILIGTSLAYNIWLYFHGQPHYLDMVSHIIIVFYLNQREVQAPFIQQGVIEETL